MREGGFDPNCYKLFLITSSDKFISGAGEHQLAQAQEITDQAGPEIVEFQTHQVTGSAKFSRKSG